MRKLLFISVFFCSFFGNGQAPVCAGNINNVFIDSCAINPVIRKIPKGYGNIKGILKYARSVCKTDQDKAYFIYCYIATHFSYDENRAHLIAVNKVKRELYTKELLSKKKGVCGDFSNFYKLLSDSLGLKCLRVDGYTSGGILFVTPNESKFDHAWNIVSVNGEWMNVDATWGIDGNELNMKGFRLNLKYLFADEKLFGLSHMAADPVYQLTTEKKTFKEFRWRQKDISLERDSTINMQIDKRYSLSEKDRTFTELKSQLAFSKAPKVAIFSMVMAKSNALTDKKNPEIKRLKIENYENAISWYKDMEMYSNELNKKDQRKLEYTIAKEIKSCEKKMKKLKR